MPSGRQIRAARGLLDWSAEDLARETGLTRHTINSIEGGADSKETSLNLIAAAFDRQAIEFTGGEGVKFREIDMRTFTGKESYRQMLDHIHAVMSKSKGGRLYQIASDAKYLAYAGDYVDTYTQKMAAISGLDSRALTEEGDSHFPAPYCKYRWLAKGSPKMAPFCVYGDHVVLPVRETKHHMELISVHSKLMADRYVEQFMDLWGEASEPKVKAKAKK